MFEIACRREAMTAQLIREVYVELVVVLFLFLVTMPAALMATAHVYAVHHQDVRDRFLVLLQDGAASEIVAADHSQRFGVCIEHVWNSSVKGYSGSISLRKVEKVKADHRVVKVERMEEDEFLRT